MPTLPPAHPICAQKVMACEKTDSGKTANGKIIASSTLGADWLARFTPPPILARVKARLVVANIESAQSVIGGWQAGKPDSSGIYEFLLLFKMIIRLLWGYQWQRGGRKGCR